MRTMVKKQKNRGKNKVEKEKNKSTKFPKISRAALTASLSLGRLLLQAVLVHVCYLALVAA